MESCCHGCDFCGGGVGLVVSGGGLVVGGDHNCFNPLPLLQLSWGLPVLLEIILRKKVLSWS